MFKHMQWPVQTVRKISRMLTIVNAKFPQFSDTLHPTAKTATIHKHGSSSPCEPNSNTISTSSYRGKCSNNHSADDVILSSPISQEDRRAFRVILFTRIFSAALKKFTTYVRSSILGDFQYSAMQQLI